ncbi:hypothetical protein EDB85DRAFT_2172848 [Lactarius pseudohatsudake]|nr:hypothetical protein EDB85DRAFT_2172848 [Lactarius pseudohatsudake]
MSARKGGRTRACRPRRLQPPSPICGALLARKGSARGHVAPALPLRPRRPVRTERGHARATRGPAQSPSLIGRGARYARARDALPSPPPPSAAARTRGKGAREGTRLPVPPFPIRAEGGRTRARGPFLLGRAVLYAQKGARMGAPPPALPFPIRAEGGARGNAASLPLSPSRLSPSRGTWPHSYVFFFFHFVFFLLISTFAAPLNTTTSPAAPRPRPRHIDVAATPLDPTDTATTTTTPPRRRHLDTASPLPQLDPAAPAPSRHNPHHHLDAGTAITTHPVHPDPTSTGVISTPHRHLDALHHHYIRSPRPRLDPTRPHRRRFDTAATARSTPQSPTYPTHPDPTSTPPPTPPPSFTRPTPRRRFDTAATATRLNLPHQHGRHCHLAVAPVPSPPDTLLELPVAIFHPATVLPPPPEPSPYAAPDAYLDPYLNCNPSASPPHLPTPMPMPYAERAQSPLYVYPVTPPLAITQWTALVPTCSSCIRWLSLLRTAAATSVSEHQPDLRTGCNPPIWTAHPITYSVLSLITNCGGQVIGHGTLAARISYHLRATSRACSISPPLPPPTRVEVEALAPKPMLSPKFVSETLDVDPFAPSFGRVGTRTRNLSVVKLEEMAARAAAEMEAKAATDKTLPAPPVPSGKPLGHSELRRPSATDVFGNEQVSTEPEMVPRAYRLSALSLLRPPQRHDQPVFAGRGWMTEDSALDALERRLVEQVGTCKYPPAPTAMADPAPVSAHRLAEDAADDYPATHPLIRSTTDTDDPRETPYSLNTDGSPMYKQDLGVMGPAAHQPLVTLNTRVPTGFKANQGTDYIPFRIVSPDGVEREARYIQVIMGPDPLVVGIINESDKVYAHPLYAAPRFTYSGKPIYPNNDMVLFTEAFEDRARVDRCLDAIHDPSLTAEVHRYRAAAREEERLNQRIDDLIAALGEVAGQSTSSHRRLEMANAMERIEDEAGTMVDHELTRKKTRRGRKVGQQPQRTRIRYEEEGFGASGRRT